MNGNSGLKIIKIVCLALVAFVICFQLYQSLYDPITTGAVIHYETYNGIDITAFAIRDEKIVTTDKEGVISYNVDDGGKIEKNGAIANVYRSESDAADAKRIEELETAIKDLEQIEAYNDTEAVDLELIDSKIKASFENFIKETDSGDIASVSGDKELLKLMNRRQVITGVSSGFGAALSEQKSELASLKAKGAGSFSEVTSDSAGYFVSVVDGYESVFSGKDVEALTANNITEAKPRENMSDERIVGKIVSDYEWYLAAVVSLNESLKLKKGDEMTLFTYFDSVKELPVKVKSINKGSAGDKALVIFSCTIMNSDLARMRSQKMTIVLERYSGLQVNSKAVCFVDGKKGVYVLSGSVMNFVPIEIIYSTDSYHICKAGTTGKRLKLYDEVIIKGKDLYDGKVIN